jgi:hypothetical protein
MGLFSGLFGGDKKKAAKAETAPAKPAPAKSATADAVAPKATSKLAAAAAPTAIPASGVATGVSQVKLRLKLVQSLRAGKHSAAYEAAKGLADIQAKAGRRTGARIWREQAERIQAQA